MGDHDLADVGGGRIVWLEPLDGVVQRGGDRHHAAGSPDRHQGVAPSGRGERVERGLEVLAVPHGQVREPRWELVGRQQLRHRLGELRLTDPMQVFQVRQIEQILVNHRIVGRVQDVPGDEVAAVEFPLWPRDQAGVGRIGIATGPDPDPRTTDHAGASGSGAR
ncbi:hypothetical protein OG563_33330 [Nocardia vinacea]|uniref:Uncharacterized protein n=1 Tax=Nocardia vinacea TaxID=96468 RepID=A0ABZ1YLW9_9NOCA|nr:hypothetical protein [Nocardia vinacea]